MVIPKIQRFSEWKKAFIFLNFGHICFQFDLYASLLVVPPMQSSPYIENKTDSSIFMLPIQQQQQGENSDWIKRQTTYSRSCAHRQN